MGEEKRLKGISVTISGPVKALMEREAEFGKPRPDFVRDAIERAFRDAVDLGVPFESWDGVFKYSFPFTRGTRALFDMLADHESERRILLHGARAYRNFVAWHAGAVMERERIIFTLRALRLRAASPEARAALDAAILAIETDDGERMEAWNETHT